MQNKTSQKIGITGGAGLIGSELASILVNSGKDVVIIDDFSKGRMCNIEKFIDKIEVRKGNLEEKTFASSAFDDLDIVYHLASRAYGVGYGKGHHLETLAHNEKITTNLFENLEKTKPKKLLVMSSSCVYDDNSPDYTPELEVFHGEPETANKGYGWAKRFLEQKATLFSEEMNIPIVIPRPFNIYGEKYCWAGEYSQAIPMLVKRILDGDNPLYIWGSGNQIRNYMHSFDCARVLIELMALNQKMSPVNIATNTSISVRDLVFKLQRIFEKNNPIEFDTTKPEGRLVKTSDNNYFNQLLPNFEFEIPLEVGLQRMGNWYSQNFIK